MNRDELQHSLQAQRQRRQAGAYPLAPVPGRNRSPFLLPGTAVFFLLMAAALFLPRLLSETKSSPAVMRAKQDQVILSQSIPPPLFVPTPSPAPTQAFVCTDVLGGFLHVRAAPGTGAEVLGYLKEGAQVQLVLAPDGSLWLPIEAPIPGWVHSRYICNLFEGE